MSVTISELSQLLNDGTHKSDTSFWGVVKEKIVKDGACTGYQVSLGDDDDIIECRRLAGANVGDTVLVTVTPNGAMIVTGRIDGDQDIIDTNTNISTNYSTTLATINLIYPVGSIYLSTNSTNPSNLFTGTTWEAYSQGRVLVGNGTSDRSFSAGSTGGESTHTLTSNEAAQKSITIGYDGGHSHNVTVPNAPNSENYVEKGSTTSWQYCSYNTTRNLNGVTTSEGEHYHSVSGENANSAHNNLQPYIVCYMWRRTA